MKKPVVKSPTRTPSRASRKPAANSAASRSTDEPSASAGGTPPVRAPKNILTAGIKALTHVHEEAVARQSRVFESLLGLGSKRADEAAVATDHAPQTTTTLDPFGFRKFEDVFDQRVARAMENLQVPTAQAFADLTAEVERLRDAVATLEAQARQARKR